MIASSPHTVYGDTRNEEVVLLTSTGSYFRISKDAAHADRIINEPRRVQSDAMTYGRTYLEHQRDLDDPETISIWLVEVETSNRRQLGSMRANGVPVAASRDGEVFALLNRRNSLVTFNNGDTLTLPLSTPNGIDPIYRGMQLSTDGQSLLVWESQDKRAFVYNVSSRTLQRFSDVIALPSVQQRFRSMSGDGRYVVGVAGDTARVSILTWRIANGSSLVVFDRVNDTHVKVALPTNSDVLSYVSLLENDEAILAVTRTGRVFRWTFPALKLVDSFQLRTVSSRHPLHESTLSFDVDDAKNRYVFTCSFGAGDSGVTEIVQRPITTVRNEIDKRADVAQGNYFSNTGVFELGIDNIQSIRLFTISGQELHVPYVVDGSRLIIPTRLLGVGVHSVHCYSSDGLARVFMLLNQP